MPEHQFIVIPEGKICDYIDGKLRNDTPVEYVRQTIEKRLINELKYAPAQIKVGCGLQIGSRKPRADLVIWNMDDDHIQDNIKIIIQCKKSTVDAQSSSDGINQLQQYMSACPACEWGMWTNSLQKYVFRKTIEDNGQYNYLEYNDIPSANGNIYEVDRPTRQNLKNASDDNLLFVFRTCHNLIYINEGFQKQPAFFELLKIIFCKIEDERNIPHQLEFCVSSKDRSNPDGQLTVYKRISAIFQRVKNRYSKIFEERDEIQLNPRTLACIVGELQGYSLLNTNIDIKSKAYEEIVGANLRGDRGEFFTPRNIMKMVVEMINPLPYEKTADISCGTGGFIVSAMNHAITQLERNFTVRLNLKREDWDDNTVLLFREKVSQMTGSNFFGFDINPDLVKATRMNMVMNNDGSSNILQINSLLPPHEWPDYFKKSLADALGIEADEIRNHHTIEFFDVIVTNPPFGSKIPVKDESILRQYQLAHIWENNKQTGRWTMTNKLQSSVPPEILFLERCTQFMVPGGRLGIVLPDSILGSPGLGYIREWLIKNHRIIASIDLHPDTFQPHNGTQTSALILQKKNENEKSYETRKEKISDYNIFMAIVDKIGHDKRGNPLFKRDKEGNEILISEEDNVLEMGTTHNGSRTVTRHLRTRKIEDDQTSAIPPVFAEWKLREGILW